MTRYSLLSGVLIGGLVAASPCAGQTRVTIDARGAAQKRSTVAASAVIEVVVENKNPFLYRYRTTISETIVQETAALAFIAQLSPLLAGVIPALAAPGRPPDFDVVCDTDPRPTPARVKELTDFWTRVRLQHGLADKTLADVLAKYTKARAGYERARASLRNGRATTEELKTAGAALKQAAADFPDSAEADKVESQVKETAATAKLLAGAVEAFVKAFPTCRLVTQADAEDLLVRMHVEADAVYGWWLETGTGKISELRKALEEVESSVEAVDKAEVENEYEETHIIGNFEGPTNVTVTVERWPLADAEAKNKTVVAKAVVWFGGGSRFLLSGGMGVVRDVHRQQFQQVRGFEKTVDGAVVGRDLTTVVGLKRDDRSLVAPMLLLNTRLWAPMGRPTWLGSIFGTMGMSAKKDGDVDVDYLAGLSLGLLGDRILLTAGWYFAQVEYLSGDLYLGAKIPEALTTIPVEKHRDQGTAFLVTFKIK